MAQRRQKPCAQPGCGQLTRTRYCDEHGGANNWQGWQREHGSSTARGYGAEWRRLRAAVLARDNHLCQCSDCRERGRIRVAHHVDHIIPKAHGGTDDPANLQAINRDCHRRKTARERLRGGGGVEKSRA